MTPEIRESYISTSKYARRGIGNFAGTPPLPTESTQAEPGSEEKILILIKRAESKQQLFHPEDKSIAPKGLLLGRESKSRVFFRIPGKVGEGILDLNNEMPFFKYGEQTSIIRRLKKVKRTRAQCIAIQKKMMSKMFRKIRRKSDD